ECFCRQHRNEYPSHTVWVRRVSSSIHWLPQCRPQGTQILSQLMRFSPLSIGVYIIDGRRLIILQFRREPSLCYLSNLYMEVNREKNRGSDQTALSCKKCVSSMNIRSK